MVKGVLGFGRVAAVEEEVTTTRLTVGDLAAARRALRAPLTVSGMMVWGSAERVTLAATWATALTPDYAAIETKDHIRTMNEEMNIDVRTHL